ncbi:MAG: hypothetical protein PHW46_01040 [Candidatus Omnitrophica bacterium]|nr:hypothetical protein [Candidatus Omnitrophota bacterium]
MKELSFPAKLALAMLLLFMIVNFITTLSPPIARDALKYHLFLPKNYCLHHSIAPVPGNIYSFFPQFTEMLYTFCLALANDYSAHLIHYYFGILTLFSICALVKKNSSAERAIFVGLIFYSMPIVSQLSGWAYVDLVLLFYIFTGLVLFFEALENKNSFLLLISAIPFGISLGIKYLALFPILVISMILWAGYLFSSPDKRTFPFKTLFIFFTLIFAIASPWYIRNILLVKNPFFPFFSSIFGVKGWEAESALMYDTLLRTYGAGTHLKDLLLAPFRLSNYGTSFKYFDGVIGAGCLVFLLLLPFKKPRKRKIVYLLICSLCLFFLWFYSSQQSRFLLPAVAIACVSFYSIFEHRVLGIIAAGLVITIALFNIFFVVSNPLFKKTFSFIVRTPDRDTFLLENLYNYAPIKYINDQLPDNSKTYFILVGNIGYYVDKPFVQESVFEDRLFRKVVTTSNSPDEIYDNFTKQGITHLLINENMAAKYLYPDIPPEKIKQFKDFSSKSLDIMYRKNSFSLYRIKPQ